MKEFKNVNKLVRLNEVMDFYMENSDKDSALEAPFEWKSRAWKAFKSGDVEEMRKSGAPQAQWEVMRTAFESKNEGKRLDAAKYILEQCGHGPVQKVDNTHHYDKMPTDQLVAILKSKVEALQSINPELNLEKLFSATAVDGELVEEEVEGE